MGVFVERVLGAVQLFNRITVTGILITAFSLLIYIGMYNRRSHIARAYTIVLACLIGTSLGDLLTQISLRDTDIWLRLQWVGIAFIPAAALALSDSLLRATGDASPLRRLAPKVGYGLGVVVLMLVLFTDLLARPGVGSLRLPHLLAGPLFFPFAFYYFASTAWATYNVIEARRRSLTATSKRRMTYFALAFSVPALGMFPYLLPVGWPSMFPLLIPWVGVLLVNMAVGASITWMGYTVAYFSASAPDRVIKRRMVKYIIRGPLLAVLVIAALVLSTRIEKWLDLPGMVIGLIAAATIILMSHVFISSLLPTLDRIIAGDDSREVKRLQQFSEHLMTTSDLTQYLENILAALCDLLRARTAFVTTCLTPDEDPCQSPINVVIGNFAQAESASRGAGEVSVRPVLPVPPDAVRSATVLRPPVAPSPNGNTNGNGAGTGSGISYPNGSGAGNGTSAGAGESPANTSANGALSLGALDEEIEVDDRFAPRRQFKLEHDFIVWEGYWLVPLRSREDGGVNGVMGLAARTSEPELTDEEREGIAVLVAQAARALEDAAKQRRAFEALERLVPEADDMQRRMAETRYPGAPTVSDFERVPVDNHDDFTHLVRDALSQYWGGPKLAESPLVNLRIVSEAMKQENGNATKALRRVLGEAIERLKPDGTRSFTAAEWMLYNILELKFIQSHKVRDVARRLVMSESDLYRKQRAAFEEVARIVSEMERDARQRDQRGEGGERAEQRETHPGPQAIGHESAQTPPPLASASSSAPAQAVPPRA